MGKRVPMWQVLFCIVFALGIICYSIFYSYGEAHMPMILAAAVVATVGALNGWKWNVMEKGMIQGISRSMQANLILLTVGILVATWKAGGIIPSIIYYGLDIISPGFFLVTACLLCSIISLVIGSSYTTAGTIGVAMIGIAIGLGINPALAAGAIVAGAYTGDKMSPMSDTTNMAPAVSGSNIFDHIRHMVYTVTPSYIIALVLYFILGRGAAPSGNIQMEMKDILQEAILNEFTVSPFLMLPIVFLLGAVFLKVPALPAIFGGVLMGMFCMGVVQGIDFADFFYTMHYGYESISKEIPLSGDYTVGSVVGGGGFDGMLWTVSIVLCSMSFAGVLEATGMLSQLVEKMMKVAKTNGLLIMTTILTCFFVNVLTADQYLSIILPGRMYKTAFEDRRLKAKNLSRCLEDSGTLTSPLIPWNVCGTTMSGFLGVKTIQYAPYAFVNYICPIVSMIYGFTGFTIEKMSDEEYNKMLELRKLEEEETARAMEA
ncbi:Sodium/proton antiporter [uncultured Eubacterium sp.]|nr:Sodium/proton antiporter [uncultured Eubacterium sp.]